jgi:hypothetical protein
MCQEVGKLNFLKAQIANPQILGLILLSQTRTFLMHASPQITNPQIFIVNPQIRKFLQNTAQLCIKTVLKVVFLLDFLLYTNFN